MIYKQIEILKNEWLKSTGCTILPLIEYIRRKGEFRDVQINAVETYLFLKLNCGNRPLFSLFADELFSPRENLAELNINQKTRKIFESDKSARSLYEFSRMKNGNGTSLFPELEKYILENSSKIDFEGIIRKIFYSVDYPDYIFSLPMGAGKTFLMASFIYLDLYFAMNEPANKVFAHNFIILVPSGLKSSIVPSLKTIQNFDPTWIIPEPAASNIKKILKFEVMDQSKSAKKSNRARNPNAQKIAQFQPFDSLMGLVMVVNAEKVILDRLDVDKTGDLIQKTDDDKDRLANELRNLIGKIPNLAIHIDEVHHAAKDDIKLRQVVNKWNKGGTITGVFGYSGTPYLSPAEKIEISGSVNLKLSQISNTVCYYPLSTAIEKFLKKPKVEVAYGFGPIETIRKGVENFYSKYGPKYYQNGCCAKLAIYCGSIERLESQVFPFLTGEMKINPDDILKFHRGNKKYKLPKENELDFISLDIPATKAGSSKKIILLVQVGKEGWDCRSLTGVILSQQGDCKTNMVLQTSCRCLRQVDKGMDESAIIWLNEFNAEKLNNQLREEQKTSIEEINRLDKAKPFEAMLQVSRLEYLKLPKVNFYQLKVQYNDLVIEESPDTENKLRSISLDDMGMRNSLIIRHRGLTHIKETATHVYFSGNETADFNVWLFDMAKESFNRLELKNLTEYKKILSEIFGQITFEKDGTRYFNNVFRRKEINSAVRLAFHCRRGLKTESELVPENASMLIVGNLRNVPKHEKLYPDEKTSKQILEMDKAGSDPAEALRDLLDKFEEIKKVNPLFSSMMTTPSLEPAVHDKNRTFHYLPYDFAQSAFELNFLKEALNLEEIVSENLELYYNGDRYLTDFQILCYAKTRNSLKFIGRYTPDFLLIKRRTGEIHKILIIETKGSGYAEQKSFILRRQFIESDFISMNNGKFGYDKFDYLYLPDSDSMNDNIAKLNRTIIKFFKG